MMANLLSEFVPQFEDRSPRARPVQQTILDALVQSVVQSGVDMFKAGGNALAGKYRRKPETPGYWSDADEAMQLIMENQMAREAWNAGLNMVGAPGLTGGMPGVGSGAARMRYNPLTDPERMAIAQEEAVRKRGLGIPTGKDAAGWDFKRPDPEKGSWAESVAKARSGTRNAISEALEAYRYGTNPLMSAEDWAEVAKKGFVLGSGTADKNAAAALTGIRAYHGSPHDFDRFDISKIGTGEGAQAYGHGLYFAENEGVAKSYRDTLSKMNQRPVVAQTDGAFGNVPMLEQDPTRPGRMYEVNINADPAHFLDWDAPLSKQPQHVRDALKPQIDRYYDDVVKSYDARRRGPEAGWGEIATSGPAPTRAEVEARMTGRELWQMVDNTRESPFSARASELREAGIPGIKYLDQGSRAATPTQMRLWQDMLDKAKASGDMPKYEAMKKRFEDAGMNQTRNYVVFDDALVNIVRKYGISGLSMLPPAAAAYLSHKVRPVDYDPFGQPVEHDPFAPRT